MSGDTDTKLHFDTDTIKFDTAGSERVRIDSSGRLLVGTASGDGSANKFQVKGNTSSGNTGGGISLSRGAVPTAVNQTLGLIDFGDGNGDVYAEIKTQCDGAAAAGDAPGRLVFLTTADGSSTPTERFRIASGGQTFFRSEFSGVTSAIANNAAAGDAIFRGRHSATTINNGTLAFQVNADGDCENANNRYTGFSDIKLKENIQDAGSQWDDLKALRVRKYNFKEETGHQTHTQIGLVAQEVEPICPGLVSESIDRDENDVDLGTVTKSVTYSVLYMKAVKALQEAMERIETLEASNADLAARLTALEGGAAQ
jgi:hypothetical protein